MRHTFATRLLLLAAVLAGTAVRADAAASPPATAAREAIQAYLAENAGIEGAEAYVGNLRLHDPAGADGGGEIVRIRADIPARSGRGVSCTLFVRDGRGDIREVRAVADVSILVPVVVSARNLPAGTVFREGDAAVRKKEIAQGADDFLHAEAAVRGKRTRWQLSAGIPVRREYLEDPESLRRGDSVLIVAETGPVRITGKGISLQSGRIGEVVTVRNAASGRELAGRLQAGRIVRID